MPHLRFPRLNMRIRLAIALTLVMFTSLVAVKPASAAVLYEGWSKVLISGKHVGYIVQRYDFDEKKKEFREIHFLKTSAESGGLTESLVARSDASFKPVAYQYTTLVGSKPTLIDASFKADKMTASVSEGKEKKTLKNTLPKGAFLSTFLGYVMLQGKEGLKKGVKYSYDGIMEETGTITKGEAYISEEESVSGIPVFRILNTINGAKYISLVSHKAEVLGTVSPSAGAQTVLVATMEEAVAGFGVNNQTLSKLFGSVPKGKENEIARRAAMPQPKVPPAPAAGSATATKIAPDSKAPAAPPVSAPATGDIKSPGVTTPPSTAPTFNAPAAASPAPAGK